jgi:hypothetical protein
MRRPVLSESRETFAKHMQAGRYAPPSPRLGSVRSSVEAEQCPRSQGALLLAKSPTARKASCRLVEPEQRSSGWLAAEPDGILPTLSVQAGLVRTLPAE